MVSADSEPQSIAEMSAPTSSGCRGMGDSVGAGLSKDENRPRSLEKSRLQEFDLSHDAADLLSGASHVLPAGNFWEK